MGRVKIVSASAGSGKTYNLAYSYVRTAIENPSQYRHILAVTFTNKATDEMKQRILQQLNLLTKGENADFKQRLANDTGLDKDVIRRRATEVQNNILHDYNNFSILTIDKFFQRIIRSFIKELGIDLNFNLELKTDSLLNRAADRLLDDLSTDNDLRKWVMAFVGENIEDGRAWDIKKELIGLGQELFREEFKKVSIKPDDKPKLSAVVKEARKQANTAADKYTSAAKRFVALLDRQALTTEDFKGRNSSVAAYAQKAAGGSFARPGANVKAATDDNVWYVKNAPRAADIDAVSNEMRQILTEMQPLLGQAIKAENTANILQSYYRNFALLADLRKRIDDICSEEGILPISDVNDLISKLVSDSDAPFIYEKSGNRYSDFMIDEFQDTSAMQWRNFVPLLQNALAQSNGEPVLLVGDVKQSIYRWRGGDWSLLSKKAQNEFNQTVKQSLLDNYRSAKNLVEFNNALIGRAVVSLEKMLSEKLKEGVSDGLLTNELYDRLNNTVAEAYADFVQTPHNTAEEGYVTVLEYDKSTEAHPIIERIEDLQRRGYRASDIAVLVRTNTEASKIASVILDYKRLHPDSEYKFDVVTQEALSVSSSDAVRFITACLSIAVNPSDAISCAIYNRYMKREFGCGLPDAEADFLAEIAMLQPEEAFEEIMLRYAPCENKDEIPYVQALHGQIIAYCSNKIADTGLFLEWWNESGRKENITLPQDADAITIVTIHKSKGLGFNAVILPYCSWSTLPLANSNVWFEPNKKLTDAAEVFPVKYTKDAGESEFSQAYYTETVMSGVDALNALYVAVTRAKEELHIMIPSGCRQTSAGAMVSAAVGQIDGMDISEGIATYGVCLQHTPKEMNPSVDSGFDTFSPREKVAVRYTHQRYTEDGNTPRLAPRDYGILMHRVFEASSTLDDIARSTDLLVLNGEIAADEAAVLRSHIAKAFENPTIKEWFEAPWDEVRNENEIIAGGQTFRPDRVMIRGNTAVIVDYKFGLQRSGKYEKQLSSYLSLLKDMGYEDVKGYIWYIVADTLVGINL